MKNKSVVIICGDPESTFNEILIKKLKNKVYKNSKFPIIIICSERLFKNELKKLKTKINFQKFENQTNLSKNHIYIIDIPVYVLRRIVKKVQVQLSPQLKPIGHVSLNLIRVSLQHLVFQVRNDPFCGGGNARPTERRGQPRHEFFSSLHAVDRCRTMLHHISEAPVPPDAFLNARHRCQFFHDGGRQSGEESGSRRQRPRLGLRSQYSTSRARKRATAGEPIAKGHEEVEDRGGEKRRETPRETL